MSAEPTSVFERRRWLLWMALALLALHLAVLAWGGSAQAGLYSSAVQVLAAALALTACLMAAFASRRFSRRVWIYTALALSVWTLGQVLSTLYESVLRVPVASPWPSAELFFFWVAPLVFILFVDPEAAPLRLDWVEVLDIAQVLIFALAAHLYFFYLPSLWRDVQPMRWRVLRVDALRDGLLTAALVARTLFAGRGTGRNLFGRIALFYACFAAGDLLYDYAQAAYSVQSGTWFDLVWTLPFLLLTLAAATWQEGPLEAEAARFAPIQGLVPQFAPILLPLAVMVMAGRIAEQEPWLAAGVFGASLACAVARMMIAQQRHRQSQAALRLSEENYRRIIEHAPVGISQTTRDGRFLMVNPALVRILGYDSAEELLAKPVHELYVDPAERATVLNGYEQGASAFQAVWKRKDGTPITVRVNGLAQRDAMGSVTHYLGFTEDVTEQQALEHQLRQAQKMEAVGRLAGGVAHDFNNMLTIIKGYSNLLAERLGSGHELQALVRPMEEAATRAAALTRQLLAFSRQQVLQPQVLLLNNVIANLEKMLHRLIGEDIEMTSASRPPLGAVRADPGQVEQIIMNLVVNARDAMPRGGKIVIETANADVDEALAQRFPPMHAGRYVLLTVRDTGVGMDKDTQARIFEPFFTTKELGKGTGLGLSTVYGIVKQSGGYIWVESAPNEGTIFKIYLPQVDEMPRPGVAPEPRKAPEAAVETVLLMEDDVPVRELARAVLASAGYTVLAAKDVRDARQICEQHPGAIQVLVTDMVMPEMNGAELATWVKRRRPDIKVVLISGYSDKDVLGSTPPGALFLQKPFNKSSLIGKIKEAMQPSAAPTRVQ